MALDWQDGMPFSARFGDVYFSADSGLEETRHVFLKGNNLNQRFASLSGHTCFTIGETGFGTGLNFLGAWQLFEAVAPSCAQLDFFSIEKFPLEDDELHAALALWPELQRYMPELLKRWKRRVPGWNRWSFAGGRVRLTLAIADVADALPQLHSDSMDAWFMDGFSPAKNPEMWSAPVLAEIARASRPSATLATYTSAGWIRRGLQQAGFTVERVPGFGRKREMMRGQKSSDFSAEVIHKPALPGSAIVIGGGVAGCATAYALAKRGVTVTLLERAHQLASGASGNPRGILHARFGASNNALQQFVLAAYGHALALFDDVLPVDGKLRAECGLLQLNFSASEDKRISRLAGRDWPAHLLRFVDRAQASELAGIPIKQGGLWLPGSGWVVPPALCAKLTDDVRISRFFSHSVNRLFKTETGWCATGKDVQDNAWQFEANAIVVCCAHSALSLAQFAHFPLTPVRGQISLLPATQASKALRAVVCGEVYCAPEESDTHVIGATHSFNNESLEVLSCDHLDNLSKLAEQIPALHETFGEIDINHLEGRASVRCSAPGAMPLVGEVQLGLYCSLAHGTRGLLTAGLSAEIIAAMLYGQLLPLPGSILNALAPIQRTRPK